jgi:hypothetical protein
MKQSIGKTYAQLIKFGRLLENHKRANEITDDKPELIMHIVDMIDKDLRFTKVDDFFSIFPPIKRYKDDGSWDYKSTMEMRQERLGTHFGKDDFKHLIMSSCYENKYLHLVGLSFMWSISRMHERQTGGNLFMEFLNSRESH